MKALILAAGEAKRLKPISENIPKCLLRVGDRSIIDYQINGLREAGVTEAVVVTGFLAEKLESHLIKTHSDFTFTFILNEDYYKTYPAYGLWLGRAYLTSSFIYVNADVVCHPQIIKEIVDSPYPSVTAIQDIPWDEEAVNLVVDDERKVLQIGKTIAPEISYGEFIGVTKIDATFGIALVEALEQFIEREEFKKFAVDAINLTIQRGHELYAHDVTELPAIEIDTPDDLIEAQAKIALLQ